ncbi:Nup133 protein [Saccharomycopsis crataegensis]|uniref:Nup133 protein n=1 Tax=Saccharomycopsis crataegensis TaxID=43959 RepID=A0AAV5QGW2_9ASCO|nr:Nup133 protein [Saccharomycopsis crataegensis]
MDSQSIFNQASFRFAARQNVSTPATTQPNGGAAEDSTMTSIDDDSSFQSRKDTTFSQKQGEPPQEINIQAPSNSIELTRNDQYRVSKLKALPKILAEEECDGLHGYIDQYSKYACVSSSGSVDIWNYASTDPTPITYTIDSDETLQKNSNNILPVLVLPSPGIKEPGLVSIDTVTGDIKYYEYVFSDSSVSMIYQKDNVSKRISLYAGEVITMYENIEPVGIVIATSHGRVILISLRDSAGKPNIQISNIISSSFLPFFRSKDQIVSIKGGKDLGHGTKSLSIITDSGLFTLWSVARDGQAIKIYETSVTDQLLGEIKDLYENDNITILDSHPLSTDTDDEQEAYLVLTSVENGANETCYILFTMVRNGDELMVFSAYRLTRYTKPYQNSVPKLYLPKPEMTAFIVFEDAIVLVEVTQKLEHSLVTNRKWEDVVLFRSGVKIIGTGFEDYSYEDGVFTNLPSVIVVSKKAGVLKIERCISSDDLKDTQQSFTSTSFTKSKIEQAVFYGYTDNNPLLFNVPENTIIEESEIEQAIISVGDELVGSKSAYLPPRLSSLAGHLELRLLKLKNLAEYVAVNFIHEITTNTKMKVISDLEKINAAYKIWSVLESYYYAPEGKQIIEFFCNSIKDTIGGESAVEKQIIENFFYYHVDKMGQFLSQITTRLLESFNQSNYSVAVLLVIKSIKEGAIDVETDIKNLFQMTSSEIGTEIPWILEGDLCFKLNDLHHSYHEAAAEFANSSNTAEVANHLVSLVSTLFFSFNQGLAFYTAKSLTKATREEIQRYKSVYESNRGIWISSLTEFNEMNAALQLAENFEDLLSLVRICDGEKDRVLSNGLDDTFVKERLDSYFEKFGYRFAETLYNYYVLNGKLQELLLGFPKYNSLLKRFLSSGNHGRISWIRNILDGEYFDSAYDLYTIANKADDLVSNKKLQLSVAKLSVLAQDEDQYNPNSDDILADIETGLTVLDIQENLYNQVSGLVHFEDDSDLVTETDRVLALLTSYLQKRSPIVNFLNLRKHLSKLLSNKSVPATELIDLYTLLDTKTPEMKMNFYQALKLVGTGFLSYSEKNISEILIWRRAILADDWKEIGNSVNRTPVFIKEKMENSALCITLLQCFQDDLFATNNNNRKIRLPDLEYLTQPIPQEEVAKRYGKNLNQASLASLTEQLDKEVQLIKDIMASFDFENYVKGIIGTAQTNSGSKEVVNYQTLELA